MCVGHDTAAFGALAGCFPDGVHAAEPHVASEIAALDEVALEYPPVEDLTSVGVPRGMSP